MSRLLAALAAALLALALIGAGCGEDEPAGESTAAETTQETNGETAADSDPPGPSGEGSQNVSAAVTGFDPRGIYESASPGVVTVYSIFAGSSAAGIFGDGGGGQGQGSGFVISEDGDVLTNAHVVTDADQPGGGGPINEAREVYIKFPDRNQVKAEIVGVDLFSDVALLRVDPAGLDLHALDLGSENDVAVGEPVLAIGSPFSQDQSLSLGIVSATDRTIPGLTKFGIEGAVQTDASINPGNSGGPLLDAAGEVVGINQQINSTSGGNEGVGFAVPIDLAERSIEQLREDGEVEYAYIGVETRELYPQLAEHMGLDVESGALLAAVVPDGPADEAGLVAGDEPFKFQGVRFRGGGDVITAVNGDQITGGSDLPRIISRLNPGEEVTVDVLRDGEPEQVEVTLGERPDA